MRPLVTAVIAAVEAAAAAAVGIAVVLVPALLLWAVTFSLAAEPATMLAGAAATWALAHFAPVTLTLSPEMALSLGLPPEAFTVILSLAPLGVTLISALLGVRSGWRLGARGGAGGAGVLGGTLGFGVAAFVIAQLADPFLARSVWAVAALASLVYGVPAVIAFWVRASREEHGWWRAVVRAAQRGVERSGLPGAAALPARAAEVMRMSAAALAAVVALAAVLLACALAGGYSAIVALTQHLQLDPLGSTLLFLAQLALLPVAIVWGLAWLVGPGFVVGVGSSVTPFDTLLGPLPALPMFGAIPQGWGALGGLAPALVVLVGVTVGVLLGRRSELRRAPWSVALATPVLAAAVAGLAITLLSACATGAIGPDRLAVTGPSPWLVGSLAAAELAAGLVLGTVAARIDAARVRAALPDIVPEALRDAVGSRGARDAQADAQLTEPLEDAVRGVRGAGDPAAGVDWQDDGLLAEPAAVPQPAADPENDADWQATPVADTEVEPPQGTARRHRADAFERAFDDARWAAAALEDPRGGRQEPLPGEGVTAAPEGLPETDPSEADPFETDRFEADRFETDPSEADRSEAGISAGDTSGVDAGAAPPHGESQRETGAGTADELSETEALRAYEWNDTVDLEPEVPRERPGWRWPRSGR